MNKSTKKKSRWLFAAMPAIATLVAVLAFGLVVVGCDFGNDDNDGGDGLSDLFYQGSDQLTGKVDISGNTATIKSGSRKSLTRRRTVEYEAQYLPLALSDLEEIFQYICTKKILRFLTVTETIVEIHRVIYSKRDPDALLE
jgi:hypothetical protein